MSKGALSKVMKYELRYLDGCGDFKQMQECVWALQRQTREILNKTIQTAYHWDYQSRLHFEEKGEYLDVKAQTGYKTLDGYIYNSLNGLYADMNTSNLNATIQKAWKKYKNSRSDVAKGEMSLPSYKRDQPLVLYNKSTRLSMQGNEAVAELSLFSRTFKKAHGLSGNVRFALRLNDNTQRSIFAYALAGEYGVGQCQLIYERPKWFLLLTYNFTPEQHKLDKNKILGVDMGETVALYASSLGEYGSLRLDGGEITAFADKVEARRRSLQRQAAVCGEGRIGHGTKTRVDNVYKTREKIANFRDTINHRYSHALVEYAVKNQYGTIQMEDLSGIRQDTDFPKFLRHWTCYDLQSKIEAKAKEKGIEVVKVKPAYTSQRCSRCGNIDKDNRPSQAKFRCTQCGYETNADFNASQNLSIRGIDKLIKKTMDEKGGAKVEQP